MNKLTQKAVALLTLAVMLMSLLPVMSVSAFAATSDDEFTGELTLDYDALFEDAYIIWPSGSTSASAWTFNFRGESKSVTYSSAKCFKSFSAAYSAFTKQGTTTAVTETPVFVLIGNVTVSTTIYGNAIILGANAGISPNADVDLIAQQATDPEATWAAGSRGTETVLTGTFTHNNNATYDSAAKTAGVTEYNVIIDGVQLKNDSTVTFINNKYTSTSYATAKTVNYYVRNTVMDFNKSTIYAFTGSADTMNTHNYSLLNIRMESGRGSNTYSVHQGLFDAYASNIVIDGMFYENSVYPIINTFAGSSTSNLPTDNFSFTLKNSMLYGTQTGTRLIKVGHAPGENHLTFTGNTFYKVGYKWGIMSFSAGTDFNRTNLTVDFKHNLVFDQPSTTYCTLFEGGSHIGGPISLNLSYNRIIGYNSIFPTMNTYPFNTIRGSLRGTCSYNYVAEAFSSVSDTAGVVPAGYSDSYYDHYKFSSLLYTNSTTQTEFVSAKYYTDYKMTETSDKFDITEVDFYDDLDYVTVNNAARIIRLRVTEGVTVSNLSKSYGFKFVGSPSAVSFSSTSLSSSESTSTMTVTINGSSVTYTIYAEGHSDTVSYTELETNDPTGTFVSSRLYLYSPSGATTATFNGVTYDFSGRSYTTIAAIFSAAGSFKIPQIIVPAGTYDAITLTKQAELYGECWDSPATGGVGVDTRVPGDRWATSKETVIKGITLSSGVASSYSTNTVTVAGIVLTGAFTDTARSYGINLNFKNSAVNGGYFNLNNTGINTKSTGSLTMSGVKVVATPSTLFTGNIAYATTLDNVEFASGASSKLVSSWSSSLTSTACSLTVQNCYFDEPADGFLSALTANGTYSSSTVTLDNNALLVTASGRYVPSLLGLAPSKVKSVTVTNNWFVNKGSAFHTLFSSDSGSITFNYNRLIGFDLGGVSADKSNNYYAPYTADYMQVSNGRPYGSSYYLDPDLKATDSDLNITAVSGGTATVSETMRTVYVVGDSAALTFSHGGAYTVWADSDCTVADSLSSEGTYYVKTEYAGREYIYNVRIDAGESSEFSDAYRNDTMGTAPLFVTSLVSADNYGCRYYLDVEGQEYAFVAGIDVFATVRDALDFAKEKGITDPRIVLGTYNSDLAVNGKAKIYGGGYKTVPFTKTSDGDLDWTYNEGFDSNKTTVTDILIGPEATSLVEIYGVEMTGVYRDVTRSSSSNVTTKLENILVNKTSTDSRVLFDLFGENTSSASNTETFTAKNVYIRSAEKTRLLYEFYPANVTFDGLYVNGDTFPINTINYTKNSGTSTVLTFKNCNFRNYAPTSEYPFLFQGDDTVIESGESKSLVFENNIFYDFAFCESAIVPLQPTKYSELVFRNNKVLSTEKTYDLIYSKTNAATDGIKLDITDNLLLGVNPEISFGSSNVIASDSVVARNHTSATYSTEVSGTAITVTGATTLEESVFALDDSMSPLYKTDFVYSDVHSEDNAIFSKTLNGTAIQLSVLDGYSASDFEWSFGNDEITPVFYSDAACTQEISASSVVKGSSTYYVKASYTADDGVKWTGDAYSLLLTDITTDYPLFNHDLISDDAILVDSTVDTSETYHNTDWNGNTYSFIVGDNVFATLDQAIAKGGAGASYLIKDFGGIKGEEEYSTWLVTTPGKYYTQNFDKVPYIATDKTEDPDGSEWTANIGEGKFDPAKGIQVKTLVLNTAAAGDYEFHGFTVTDTVQDDDLLRTARSSDNDINVVLNNTYVNKTYSDQPLFSFGTHFMLDSEGEKLGDDATAFNDSVTLKNTYIENSSTKDIFGTQGSDSETMYNVNPWTHVTFDGVFADYTDAEVSSADILYIGSYGKEYSFTVTNSNFRNFNANWFFEGHNGYGIDYGTSYPNTRSLIFTDNIFYNYSFYDTSAFLQYKNTYFNEVTFDGNYIYTPADNMDLGAGNVGNAVHPDPYFTITDNVFMGINPDYDLDRWVTWSETVVKDNYCVAERPADTSVTSYGGSQFVLYVNNWKYDTDGTTKVYFQTNGDYWVDSAKSIRAYEIAPMTLDGEDFNTNGQTANLYISYDETTLNLEEHLFNPCNLITAFIDGVMVDDITDIDAATDLVIDLDVQSSDGTSDIETRTINVVHESEPAISAVSATLYNGISMNFKATGLRGTEYMTFDFAGTTYTVTDSYKDGNYTVFSLDNIAPHLMCQMITGKLYSGDTLLDTYSLTMRDYLDNLMYTDGTTTELYDLCVAILNYGAAAQIYKDFDTEDPADMFLSEDEKVIPTPYIVNQIDTTFETVSAPKATWAAHSLVLDDAIVIKLGFTTNLPVSKLSLKVEGAGYSETFTDCFWYENGKYYFTFDKFNVIQADEAFTFTVMNGTTAVSNTLSYSADCYFGTVLDDGTDASLLALTNALANYVSCAQDYYYSI